MFNNPLVVTKNYFLVPLPKVTRDCLSILIGISGRCSFIKSLSTASIWPLVFILKYSFRDTTISSYPSQQYSPTPTTPSCLLLLMTASQVQFVFLTHGSNKLPTPLFCDMFPVSRNPACFPQPSMANQWRRRI